MNSRRKRPNIVGFVSNSQLKSLPLLLLLSFSAQTSFAEQLAPGQKFGGMYLGHISDLVAFSKGNSADRRDGEPIYLEKGQQAFLTGKKPIRIMTNYGEIQIPKQTAIIAEESQGVLRVENLDGEEVVFEISIPSHSFATIKEGEELCYSPDKESPDELMIPIDGVERRILKTEQEITNGKLIKCAFDRSYMMRNEKMFYFYHGKTAKARIRKLQFKFVQLIKCHESGT